MNIYILLGFLFGGKRGDVLGFVFKALSRLDAIKAFDTNSMTQSSLQLLLIYFILSISLGIDMQHTHIFIYVNTCQYPGLSYTVSVGDWSTLSLFSLSTQGLVSPKGPPSWLTNWRQKFCRCIGIKCHAFHLSTYYYIQFLRCWLSRNLYYFFPPSRH